MRRLTILFRLVENIYRGLLFFSLITLGFYVLGNLQSFLDSTQIMLIRVVEGSALTGIILGAYAVAYRVAQIVRGRTHSVLALVQNGLGLMVNLGLAFGLGLLQSWLHV